MNQSALKKLKEVLYYDESLVTSVLNYSYEIFKKTFKEFFKFYDEHKDKVIEFSKNDIQSLNITFDELQIFQDIYFYLDRETVLFEDGFYSTMNFLRLELFRICAGDIITDKEFFVIKMLQISFNPNESGISEEDCLQYCYKRIYEMKSEQDNKIEENDESLTTIYCLYGTLLHGNKKYLTEDYVYFNVFESKDSLKEALMCEKEKLVSWVLNCKNNSGKLTPHFVNYDEDSEWKLMFLTKNKTISCIYNFYCVEFKVNKFTLDKDSSDSSILESTGDSDIKKLLKIIKPVYCPIKRISDFSIFYNYYIEYGNNSIDFDFDIINIGLSFKPKGILFPLIICCKTDLGVGIYRNLCAEFGICEKRPKFVFYNSDFEPDYFEESFLILDT